MSIKDIFRFLENIVLNELRVTRERVQTLRNYDKLRLDYIIGDLTREQISATIYSNDKIRQKNTEMINVLELQSAVGIDMFRRLISSLNTGQVFLDEVLAQISEYNKLRIYCNGLFATISNTYGMSSPYVTKKWERQYRKYNGKTLNLLLNSADGEIQTAPEAAEAATASA